MNLLTKQIYGNKIRTSNTFIGGVSATINTPALLAIKLGIATIRVQDFTIIGSDIECRIVGSYNGTNQQGLLTEMTYYDDRDGLILNMADQFIRTCDNLVWVNFPNLQTIGSENFVACHKLKKLILPKLTTSIVGYSSLRINNLLEIIELPSLTTTYNTVVDEVFSSNTSLKTLYIPKCTNLGVSELRNGIILTSSNLFNLKIYPNPFFQTSNAGAEEGDIAYARGRGATVIYVTNFTAPNPVTAPNTAMSPTRMCGHVFTFFVCSPCALSFLF